jgi:V/A-type H+/Na+-transporting ATPase subunit C
VKVAKIKYSYNPYTYARVSVMKNLLLRRDDYEKMLKMDISEITKFLQEGVYKQEINALAVKYSGLRLIDHVLNQHLTRIFLKLKIISDPNIEFLMNQYLRRYDFWNLKVIIRAKAGMPEGQDLEEIFLPVGKWEISDLRDLMQKASVREVLEASGILPPEVIREHVARYEASGNLMDIENMLDYQYLKDAIDFSKTLPVQGRLFRQFFRYEIDVHNLRLTLKRIIFKLDKNLINPYMIEGGAKLLRQILTEMKAADSMTALMTALSKTIYSKVLSNANALDDPLLSYELALDRFLYRRSLLLYHQHPLTVDVVLGFMFLKEIEIKNIRLISKSKKLGVDEDKIRDMIILDI